MHGAMGSNIAMSFLIASSEGFYHQPQLVLKL